jgi:hypothetical protein
MTTDSDLGLSRLADPEYNQGALERFVRYWTGQQTPKRGKRITLAAITAALRRFLELWAAGR